MDSLMPISDAEFQLMRDLIYRRFGINLGQEKRSLLVSRLQKILRAGHFPNFKAYHAYLLEERSGGAFSELIDHISTNHTYFSREQAHFEYLHRQALPDVVQRLRQCNSRDLRVWCAGCSSGEEAYMLLMLMRETLGSAYASYSAGLLATDISHRILETARRGMYSTERMAALPSELRHKYFVRVEQDQWQVRPELRQEAVFRRFNLMNERFPFKEPFHIIFCRNVMIYFDQQTRESLIHRFWQALAPGGYFFIGHSETLGREHGLFEYRIPAAYRKVGGC
ncbi:MAG: chemotaxis protein CheR [Desulfobulbaceae bacterium A2]|nr:MAG: chemotaxis protein CheR [Desulfobulbaceae bacterium A2]